MIAFDLGMNNLVTIVNNLGLVPMIIKGGVVKSMNQFYNKRNAFLQGFKVKQCIQCQTKQQLWLRRKRNNQIRNMFHKASAWIIDDCIKNRIGTIFIGYNEGWIQNARMVAQNNQNFVQIPFLKLIGMMEYNAKLLGIQVIVHEESYTSKCSCPDSEPIELHACYCGKRGHRGLFQSGSGILMNADVNGAFNILRKAFPNAIAEGIAGLVLTPILIRVL